MTYVDVAVNSGLPQRQAFTYAVPDGMRLGPGDAVFVPFGRRSLQGIVMTASEVAAVSETREVLAKLGEDPVVAPERVQLARWISDYYLSPLFPAVALMLPPGFERKPLTFYRSLLDAQEANAAPLPPRQRAVLSWLMEQGQTEASVIAKEVRSPGVQTALSQLLRRGLIERSYTLERPSVRAKTVRVVELIAPFEDLSDTAAELEARRKRKLSAALLQLVEVGGRLPASELRARTGVSIPDLRPLAEARLITVLDEAVERDPLAGRDYQPRAAPDLTSAQQAAFAPIAAALDRDEGGTFLLHGVTGSGKTEVYLRALERTVSLGRRAIVLVPEIALTPQTVRRFAERYVGRVAVLHSGLSQGELFDQWHAIRDGRYDVVIGSRSALFAPQPDLGLICIDEEHEWTYKQQEQAPRYHARETAEQLIRLTGAVLVLGSATPDVVSYQRALWGQYHLLELRERVRPVIERSGTIVGVGISEEMPPVEVVDMRDELKSGNRSIFSRSLQLALFQALEKGEQTILFLNRRGAAGFVQCRDCGYVPQCSSCAIALSFHRHVGYDGVEEERLLCHQCNRGRRMFLRCPLCGGSRLRPMGLGVERVEEEIGTLFPGARALRWDRDVTRGRHAHEKILARFVEGKADVLIGTQMVAKGLDLPAVTLVGVISADIGLHIPDFRSGERTFQLLTQVAGRAGRALPASGGPPPGRVVIQTYTPDNYAIVAAAQHDYTAFFSSEIGFREREAYPPFVRLARLVYSHSNQEYGQRQADRMATALREEAARRGLPGVDVLGAAPTHVPKWHGRYRWQVVVRCPDPAELLSEVTLGEGWTLDIDPASLA